MHVRRSYLFFAALAACAPASSSSAGDHDVGADGGATNVQPAAPGESSPNADGAPTASDGGAGADAEPPPVPYVHFDVNHVLSTGQSNAVANDGVPVLTTTQPYQNVMFDTGVMTGGGCDTNGCTSYQKPTSFVPLVEGDTFFYPVETMSSGLANEVSKLATEKLLVGQPHSSHDVLVSLHGRSGNSYWCLRKGGCDWWSDHDYVKPFDEAMMQVTDAKAIATNAGKSYVVRAVTAIHGEHDHYAYSSGTSHFPLPRTDGNGTLADYGEALEEWQRDYEAGVKAITGQALPVPLFISQYSHWNDVPTTKIAYQQLDAHVRSKGKVVVIGPTYMMPYSNDCLHFTNHGERHLGEYFAKAYARVVIEGRSWEPLRPISAQLAGNVVTIKYVVPVPPLVLDTERVSDPGHYGFELFDDGPSPATITKVEIVGTDTVNVTLSAPPTGASKRIRYAYTFPGCAGPTSIAHGNLHDSDKTPSQYGYDLFNWSVHFDLAL